MAVAAQIAPTLAARQAKADARYFCDIAGMADDRVVAAMNANVWDVVEPLRSLLEAPHPVDESQLIDPDVPLDALQRTVA